MPRPKTKDGEPIYFRLSEEERNLLDTTADLAGLSTNNWARMIALREARTPDRWREVELALRAAGIGDQQIAAVLGALTPK